MATPYVMASTSRLGVAKVPRDRTARDREGRAAAPPVRPSVRGASRAVGVPSRRSPGEEIGTGTGLAPGWKSGMGGGVSNGAAVAWVTGTSRGTLLPCPLALALGVGRLARTPPVTDC